MTICTTSKRNLAGNSCPDRVVDEIRQVLFIPLKKEDGTLQEWADLAAFKTWLDGTAQADLELFPSSYDLQDFAFENAESIYQDFKNGERRRLSRGARTYTFLDANGSTATHDAYEDLGSNDIGVVLIGANGNFNIREMSDGSIRPLTITKESLSPDFMPSDGAENGQQVMFSFSLSKTMRVSEMKSVHADEFGASLLGYVVPWLDIDVEFVDSVTPATQVYCAVNVIDEGLKEKSPVSGLVLADFVRFQVIGGAPVPFSDVTESSSVPGFYTLTYPSQSNVTVELRGAKDGYNWAIANSRQYVIS
jgi:hypothetical protein